MSEDYDERSSEQLRALHDATPVLTALFDERDRLRYANPAFRAAYHLADHELPTWCELMRQNHAAGRGALIVTDDFEAWLASARSRRGKLPFRAFEADLADGRWVLMTETMQTDGWMLCLATDITVLRSDERAWRQAHDIALRAAQTDELTGVGNRRHIIGELNRQLSRPAQESPSCIAILDIDHFKKINDQYGHADGDAVLIHFAQTMARALRREDCFGRIGGEEFLLLLPRAGAEVAARLLERVRRTLQAASPLRHAPDFHYTFSAGVTAIYAHDDLRSLFDRADQALYQAKASGRDRILTQP